METPVPSSVMAGALPSVAVATGAACASDEGDAADSVVVCSAVLVCSICASSVYWFAVSLARAIRISASSLAMRVS